MAEDEGQTLLYIDRHLIHEVTSPIAFSGLALQKRRPTAPERTFAMIDHIIPTVDQQAPLADAQAAHLVQKLREACRTHGISLFDIDDERNGIVHVAAPEQGLTLPGMTIVCGDSHTSTHGAFGALAFGIGTSEVEHVLATQTLRLSKPQAMRVRFNGDLPPGLGAKDMILALIGQIGVGGGSGYVIEYDGPAVRALSMEGRMTLCNMSIEGGARAGMVAPDATTFAYLQGRPSAPQAEDWEAALTYWHSLPSAPDASFDRQHQIDVAQLAPQVTWGTNPAMVSGVDARVPRPEDANSDASRQATQAALAYMGLKGGTPITDIPVERVFIGSCTNSRLEDLRLAAAYVKGKRVADGVSAMVVPGSGLVKRAAESEGLHRIFGEAGFDWREPGCSMCLGMNPDQLKPGERCASTSNRNFEGRQGKGGRTHLVNPAMAALAAVHGRFVDAREHLAHDNLKHHNLRTL